MRDTPKIGQTVRYTRNSQGYKAHGNIEWVVVGYKQMGSDSKAAVRVIPVTDLPKLYAECKYIHLSMVDLTKLEDMRSTHKNKLILIRDEYAEGNVLVHVLTNGKMSLYHVLGDGKDENSVLCLSLDTGAKDSLPKFTVRPVNSL